MNKTVPKTEKTVPFGTVSKVENSYEISKNTQTNCNHSLLKRDQNWIQRNQKNRQKNNNLRKNFLFSKKMPFRPYYDWANGKFTKHTTVCYFIPRGMFCKIKANKKLNKNWFNFTECINLFRVFSVIREFHDSGCQKHYTPQENSWCWF